MGGRGVVAGEGGCGGAVGMVHMMAEGVGMDEAGGGSAGWGVWAGKTGSAGSRGGAWLRGVKPVWE